MDDIVSLIIRNPLGIFAIIMTTSFGRPRTSPNLSSGGDLQTYRLTESQTQESKTPYTRQVYSMVTQLKLEKIELTTDGDITSKS